MIRRATTADIESMRSIELAAGVLFAEVGLTSIAEDPPPDPAELQHHIADGTAWVACRPDRDHPDHDHPDRDHPGDDHPGNDEEIVGYLVASVVDGEGHVDQVSVVPRAAGQRIGSRLIDEAIAWTLASGFDAITLTTFTDIAWNGPYYERLGFVEVPEAAMGPQLSAIRVAERDAGIDVAPRCAMRRRLK